MAVDNAPHPQLQHQVAQTSWKIHIAACTPTNQFQSLLGKRKHVIVMNVARQGYIY